MAPRASLRYEKLQRNVITTFYHKYMNQELNFTVIGSFYAFIIILNYTSR